MTPTLSIVTPTQGRPTLERMIASGRDQLLPGDEWLVVVDRHELGIADQRAIARRIVPYVFRVHSLSHDAGRHDFGHSQINHGMAHASGNWLVHLDDDDVFTPGALAAIRAAIVALPAPCPLLFRFVTPWGQTLWQPQDRDRGTVREGAIGGHCLVHPNAPGKIGQFTPRYEGDYDAIRETIDLWGGRVAWVDAVIARCRPKGSEVSA
jgi:glycosyltransferase involved in cell wall biosynthesis